VYLLHTQEGILSTTDINDIMYYCCAVWC